MSGNINMSKYSEVLLWREYNEGLNVKNNVEVAIQHGNWGTGPTRSLVESFLMEDGKPIYASAYTYNDESLQNVATNRDPRLKVFLKVPGQKNVFKNMDYAKGDISVEIEPIPDITNLQDELGYSTGYSLRKGGTFDRALCSNWNGYTAAITFRATEALLNYIQAQYMLTKSLSSGKTIEYWKIRRERAGFTGTGADPLSTIAATDINKEKLDWGAYAVNHLIISLIYNNIERGPSYHVSDARKAPPGRDTAPYGQGCSKR
ncbi:RagB/SusD family nutrient uptake outer membrane protein [Dysgonomonas reticulitermitis]